MSARPSADEVASQRKAKMDQKAARKAAALARAQTDEKEKPKEKEKVKDKDENKERDNTKNSSQKSSTKNEGISQTKSASKPPSTPIAVIPSASLPSRGSSGGSASKKKSKAADSTSPHSTPTFTSISPSNSPNLATLLSTQPIITPTHTLPPSAAPSQPRVRTTGPMLQYDNPKKVSKYNKKAQLTLTSAHSVPLFSHLPPPRTHRPPAYFSSPDIHPLIIRLGLLYANDTITGSTSRCLALLSTLQQVISEYTTPKDKVMRHDLLQRLNPWVRFLIDCRPQSISMGNAIRFLKLRISKLPPSMSEEAAKELLNREIQSFMQERILFADEIISTHAASKIHSGDTIMVYAASHVVELSLIKAHKDGKNFSVIVVDSRPKLEGISTLKRLVAHGLTCTYVLLSAVSYLMATVTKILVGAYAMLSNGSCLSRAGTAQLSLMAHVSCVPLLVCCETYKFSERVLLDSICFNELGDPEDLVSTNRGGGNSGNSLNEIKNGTSVLSGWREEKSLKLLNLVYDLTPVEFVKMVITEVGMIPPTSVPVILREYHKEDSQID